VEAPGIEAAENLTFAEENSSFLNVAGSDLAGSSGLSQRASVGRSEKLSGDRSASGAPVDAVEHALAEALQRASAAGEWGAVASLAAELAARRKARAGVVDLDHARAKRRE
jgi:hypothetical protein